MMPLRQLNVAVIGDEDLVSGMRLAGVSHYHIVKGEDDARGEVREVLSDLTAESDIGVVVLQEDYLPYVEDIVKQLREGKRLTPIIIEVPSKYGTRYEDIVGYYRSFVRKFVGFDIQI